MKPTVGRIVHYGHVVDKNSKFILEPQAAIITAVELPDQFRVGQPPPDSEENKYLVSLHIFYRTGQFDTQSVPWSGELRHGHWSWSPRESS
jgi:hypothetical protein